MPRPLAIPKIKVCGVRRQADLQTLADAGVDTVGFNFVPRSPRCLDLAQADELCAQAAALGLLRVAVVMDLPGDELQQLLSRIEVDFVQLHGQERPEIAEACQGLPIIKAVSWSGRAEELDLVTAWQDCGRLCAWLVDAYAPLVGGGSGRLARWDLLLPRPAPLARLPLILAGGLQPQNVAAAIRATAADAVDTASGVESSPGVKDAALVQQFASNARREWGQD